MIVVAFAQSAETIACIRHAACPNTTLVLRTTGSVIAVESEPRADAILIELAGDLGPLLQVVEMLRAKQPHTPIALYLALEPRCARAIMRFAQAGASEVILRGYDDLGMWFQTQRSITSALDSTHRILEHLAPRLAPSVVPFVEYCIRHAYEVPSVVSVADALGVHRRTLVNRFAAVGYPAPRLFISWCRLFVALDRMERLKRPVGETAHAMGFGSATAFYKMCTRYTGLTVVELRRGNALSTAVGIFLNRLARPSDDGEPVGPADTCKPRSPARAHSVRAASHSVLVFAQEDEKIGV